MARTIRFHEVGGPDVLGFEDLEIGEPGAREVKVRVEAIGLNRAELAYRSGKYLERPKLPSRLGYEAAGRVVVVGNDVSEFQRGDHVSVIPTFSMNEYGTYGEEILIPVEAVTACPEGFSSATCAAVWMQYLTAYGALVDIGGLRSGEFVLISAASSSVGLAAIQIALMLGAIPIALTRTSAKREALIGAGARHVIATQEQDVVAQVRAITDNRGARLVFDPIAGPFVETLAKVTAQTGMIFVYGGLSAQPTSFPSGLAMLKGFAMRGYTVFEITRDARRRERAKSFVLDGLSAGKLVPIIDRTFEFAHMAKAHSYMEAGEQIGKIIITVP